MKSKQFLCTMKIHGVITSFEDALANIGPIRKRRISVLGMAPFRQE